MPARRGSRRGRASRRPLSLAINPFDTDVLYAGTQGEGAFKSVDGGVIWSRIDVDSTVWSLLVDPSNGNVVYAGTNGNGVYKSIDGGASFARIGSPRPGIVFSLAKSGDRLYAATDVGGVVGEQGRRARPGKMRARRRDAVSRSAPTAPARSISARISRARSCFRRPSPDEPRPIEDVDSAKGSQDSKWRRLGWKHAQELRLPGGLAVSIDPSNHEHLFFGSDGGLLVSEDGGRTWEDGNRHGMSRAPPPSGCFDPQQPRRVYTGSNGHGFFKSVDHGKHWVRRDVRVRATRSSSPWPSTRSIIRCTSGTVFADGLWKSTDFGDTFTRIDRAPDAPPDEFLDFSGRGITVDPHNHTTVYFTDRSTGTWRSQDAGASWINVDPNARAECDRRSDRLQHRLRGVLCSSACSRASTAARPSP